MPRLFIRLIQATFILAILVAICGFSISAMMPEFIAKKLSEKLKVHVSLGDLHIRPKLLDLFLFEVSSLPNSYLPKAFSADRISIHAPIFGYFHEQISIEEINIENIYLGLEFDSPKGTTGNWSVLMNNLDTKTQTRSSTKSATIKTLRLTNIQVDVVYRSNGRSIQKLPVIPELILHDIDTEKGIPAQEIMQSVLGKMLESVFLQENLKNMLLDPESTLEKVLQPFQKLF